IPVVAISFDQLRQRIEHASEYLRLRSEYRIGSMEEVGGAHQEYVTLGMADQYGGTHDIVSACRLLQDGRDVVMLGDYGECKSTTLKELFDRLGRSYLAKAHAQFPIHVNLRDHQCQLNPVEAL